MNKNDEIILKIDSSYEKLGGKEESYSIEITNKKARSDEGSCLFSLFDQITLLELME